MLDRVTKLPCDQNFPLRSRYYPTHLAIKLDIHIGKYYQMNMRYTYMYIGSSMSWGHKQVTWRSWSNQMPMVSTTVNMLSTQSQYLQPHGVCPMIDWLRKRRLGFDLLVEFWILYKYLLEADRCGITNPFWDNIGGHQWMEIFIIFKTAGIIHGHGVCLKGEMDRCDWKIEEKNIWRRSTWMDLPKWEKDVQRFMYHLNDNPKMTSADVS